jgi:hypothetical protein
VAVEKDTESRRFRISIGPLGMSLAAAAITAVAFAAISLADSGKGGSTGGNGAGANAQTFPAPPPPGGGVGIATFRGDLSAADRQRMDQFRQCMQDNGAPEPPDPGDFDPGDPPKPPSAADQEKAQKAWEACKDKLPGDLQNAGPPQLHLRGCAPPAAAPGESGKEPNQDQSDD